jgi:hypothetical protein
MQKGTVANPNDIFAASFSLASRKTCVMFLCDLQINRKKLKIDINFRDENIYDILVWNKLYYLDVPFSDEI